MDVRRRMFLKSALRSAAAAAFLLTGSSARALAQRVAETDRRLLNTTEGFRTRRGRATGYLSRPIGAGPQQPGILVVHGDEGLTPHFRDVARRLAIEGFVVLAPDFLSLAQGTPEDPQAARSAMERLDDRAALAIATGAIDALVARRDTQRRLGVVGFAWGGRLAQEAALESRDVVAVVSFYGKLLDPRRARRLRIPLMVHYSPGEGDDPASLSQFRDALGSASATIHEYESVEPGFHDDGSEAHDAEAAELAWSRTTSFLKQELG